MRSIVPAFYCSVGIFFLKQNIISWSLKLVAITLTIGKLEGLLMNNISINVEVFSVIRVDTVIICLKTIDFHHVF